MYKPAQILRLEQFDLSSLASIFEVGSSETGMDRTAQI